MRQLGAALVFAVSFVLVACGPQPHPVDPDAPDDPPGGGGGGGAVAGSGGPVTPAGVCARIFELKASGCSLTADYSLSEAECQDDFHRSLEERGAEARQATTSAARCLIDNASCEAAAQCLTNLNDYANEQDGTPTELRACADTEVYAPVGLAPAEWAARPGANTHRFGEVATTKEAPIEVCGIPAQMEWLLNQTCADGSRPFASYDHAHAARAGNVGAGGRCGSIIDLYEVPCPEGAYQVFIDAYVCPLPPN